MQHNNSSGYGDKLSWPPPAGTTLATCRLYAAPWRQERGFGVTSEQCASIACAATAGLVDYVVEPGTSAEERGMVLARDIAQVRTVLTGTKCSDSSSYSAGCLLHIMPYHCRLSASGGSRWHQHAEYTLLMVRQGERLQ